MLIVPGTIDGYAVTEIGDNAFNAENIKGWYRRKPEERITAILPNTLTAIGDKAFFFCDHIATINIPASVRRIGAGAFSNTAIRCSVDSGNDDFTTIQNVLYNKGQKKLIHCPQDMVSGDNPLTIPNGIVAIGDYALYNCDGYGYTAPDEVMVVLPGTLKQIGDYAFAHCDLGSMTIPDGVTQIGAYAFQDSTFHSPEAQDHGWSLYLPASVESIGEGCFEGWMGVDTVVGRQSLLSNVYLQETQIATIPRRAFAECRLINTTPPPEDEEYGLVFLPNRVKAIEDEAFAGSEIRTAVMPETLETIGAKAFFDSTIRSLQLPDAVKTIGSEAFREAPGITTLGLPVSAEEIGENICDYLNVTLTVVPGTYAAEWAARNGYLTATRGGDDTSWLEN